MVTAELKILGFGYSVMCEKRTIQEMKRVRNSCKSDGRSLMEQLELW